MNLLWISIQQHLSEHLISLMESLCFGFKELRHSPRIQKTIVLFWNLTDNNQRYGQQANDFESLWLCWSHQAKPDKEGLKLNTKRTR